MYLMYKTYLMGSVLTYIFSVLNTYHYRDFVH